VTLYTQTLGAGYSAPGLASLTDTDTFGGTFTMPLTERLEVRAKGDRRTQQQGLETTAQELNLGYQFDRGWSVSTGVRNDQRKDESIVVPVTQEQGDRTDGVAQVRYDSGAAWSAYGFVQDTLSKSEERADNGRVGTGGAYRFGERFQLDGEVSDGDLGFGGRLGTNYLLSERTNLYLNYSLENERTDNGLYARRGSVISGVKRRSLGCLERVPRGTLSGYRVARGPHARDGAKPGRQRALEPRRERRLRHAAGYADGCERPTARRAASAWVTAARRPAVERRRVSHRRVPSSSMRRRSSGPPGCSGTISSIQLTPDWRLIGKLNHSISDSTQGDFYDGGYTEAVIGYAYRPVENDR
jgi:hypothetical protein